MVLDIKKLSAVSHQPSAVSHQQNAMAEG